MKINSFAAFTTAMSTATPSPELDALLAKATADYGVPGDDNFYKFRDFLRLNWSGAAGVLLDQGNKWVPVNGGLNGHFLHLSTDDSDKVAYTKNDEKGRADIQTRSEVGLYNDNYGCDVVLPDDVAQPAAAQATAQTAQTAQDTPVQIAPKKAATANDKGIDALLMNISERIRLDNEAKNDAGRHDDAIVAGVLAALDILATVANR